MVNNHHHMNNIYLFNIEHLDSRKEIEKFVTIKLIDWKYFFCGYFQSQKLIDFCLMMTNWNEFNGWVIIIIIIVIINEPLCLLNELFFRFYFFIFRSNRLTNHTRRHHRNFWGNSTHTEFRVRKNSSFSIHTHTHTHLIIINPLREKWGISKKKKFITNWIHYRLWLIDIRINSLIVSTYDAIWLNLYSRRFQFFFKPSFSFSNQIESYFDKFITLLSLLQLQSLSVFLPSVIIIIRPKRSGQKISNIILTDRIENCQTPKKHLNTLGCVQMDKN